MKVLDRSINAWQLGILIFILTFANKILVLPSLLYEGAGMEALFALAFLCLCEFALVLLFFFVKKRFPTQSLSQILQQRLGKGFRVVLYVFIMLFFLSKAVLLYNVTYIFFRNLIYKDTSNFLILFCFLPILNHLAICGLRVLGRTAQLFFPVIFGILLFCLIVGLFGINNRPLLFSNSFLSVIQTGARHISPFGDMMFLFLIIDRVKIKDRQWKIVFSLSGIALFFVFVISLIFMLSYTSTCFMHPYAIFEIMSFVKEYGGLGRIDIISMVLIIILAYFHLAIYLKSFMFCFKEVFEKIDQIYGVLTFNFLFVVVVVFFIVNLENAVVFGQEILPYASILPYAILPLILLFCCKNKKGNENADFQKMIKKHQKNIKKPQKNAVFCENEQNFYEKEKQKNVFERKNFEKENKEIVHLGNEKTEKENEKTEIFEQEKPAKKRQNFVRFEKQKNVFLHSGGEVER